VNFSKKKLNFCSLYRNNYPVQLEIGFGNGEALIASAESNAYKNYLGIEVYDSGIGSCLNKAKKKQINNIKICSGDAHDVLEVQIADKSLERINIYFPDPWPKKRHHKRRLIQKDFLRLCASKLKKTGQLHIATDWNNYAEHIIEIIEKNTDFIVSKHLKHNGKIKLERPTTKFEKKGLKKGHFIWDWVLTKISLG
tara:strand:+ start:149 stop:736 length:588 start_codon:yes stop_codon:yes gene_type:complete